MKNCMHLIPCHHGREYKGERGCPIKVRLEESWKPIIKDVAKSDMIDHVCREKSSPVKWSENTGVECLKELACMLG